MVPSQVILGLDLSTSTGWAIVKDAQPVCFGVISKRFGWYDSEYPKSFLDIADDIAIQVDELLNSHPEITDVVIEEVNHPSRFTSRWAQKTIDQIHYTVGKVLVRRQLKMHYINTSDWRRTLKLSVADTKKMAKPFLLEFSKLKKEFETTPTKENKAKLDTHKALLTSRCIHGKIDKKSISVAFVNTTFGLALKKGQDDEADAICQVVAWQRGCPEISGSDIFKKEGRK